MARDEIKNAAGLPIPCTQQLIHTALERLSVWFPASEDHFYPGGWDASLGYYGSGYNGWGVQTNQKYCSAVSVLAEHATDADIARRSAERALSSFRFMLASHHEGERACSDGEKWGHTWISVLGLERQLHALPYLRGIMNPADHALLRTMLCSEADWLLTNYGRGGEAGIRGCLWAKDGHNHPESNIWNGAFLWRIACLYPDAPQASAWRERALEFIATGITTEQDVDATQLWDGKPLAERCKGPNFFPNFSLDHHGYFNLGYMVICLSNVAMLHFDARLEGIQTPELLHLNTGKLWAVVKRMIMPDGRLARIGGDTRVRYAYCQEYLMPALLYAADYLQDPHALTLLERQLEMVRCEQCSNADGSFYGSRLTWLRQEDPVYYTRLESDRANALAMVVKYASLVNVPAHQEDFDACVSGGWAEPGHGEILHRSPERFASFSWSAFEPGQGLAVPGDDGHLMEWDFNLSGRVRFPKEVDFKSHRKVDGWWMQDFEGGFITQGAFIEGLEVFMGEQWRKRNLCRHQVMFCALPDGHTVVGMELATTPAYPCWVKSAEGMHYNLPNDLFNHFKRTVQGSMQDWVFDDSNRSGQTTHLPSARLLVESRIGLTGIYGGNGFGLKHPVERAGGRFKSLYTDVLTFGGRAERFLAEPNADVIDCGWAVETAAGRIARGAFFDKSMPRALQWEAARSRAVEIIGWDGETYRLFSNFSSAEQAIPGELLPEGTRTIAGPARHILPAGQGLLVALPAV